ncbi:MAG: type I-B CRISPR-associated protein Cas5b [Sarcina sp.]
MDVLKFRLSGKTAFFKKPDVNSNVYFTYGSIHKVALLGMFGAIIGYSGYNKINILSKTSNVYPEFYEKLKALKIAIEPNNKNNSINKKIQVFNNSVGYASQEAGGNLIVKEQWLENPSWNIYVLLNNDEALELKEDILNRRAKFIPYLGKNDHIANIDNIEVIKDVIKVTDFGNIDSLFKKGNIKTKFDDEADECFYRYQEYLPVALNEVTSLYEFENFIYTNMLVYDTDDLYVLNVNEKNIAFF